MILFGGSIMEKLTEIEITIYEVIKQKINLLGYSPTIRELCEFTGTKSTAIMQSYIVSLVKKGYVEKNKCKPRTIRICKEL